MSFNSAPRVIGLIGLASAGTLLWYVANHLDLFDAQAVSYSSPGGAHESVVILPVERAPKELIDIQSAISADCENLESRADDLGGNRQCFEEKMRYIKNLQLQFGELYMKDLQDGFTPAEKAELQVVLNEVERQMKLAEDMFPKGPYGVPATYCA